MSRAGCAAFAGFVLLAACGEGRGGGGALSGTLGAGADDEDPGTVPADPPGGTCTGRSDCSVDQVCVQGTCRARRTSRSGEVLAASARAQTQAGDLPGAVRTYEEAVQHFEEAGAPVPPEVLCGVAQTALAAASEAEAREAAARWADRCLRGSLPGDPARDRVLATLARLRYDGLSLAALDSAEPAERYFTEEPSRPTVDALTIQLQAPDQDSPGWTEIREALDGDVVTRAIGDCFIQDWDIRHEREARADLVIRFDTHMHDMGTYDVFSSEVEVAQGGVAEEGFEPCLANALGPLLSEDAPRMSRVVSWQAPVEVRARL